MSLANSMVSSVPCAAKAVYGFCRLTIKIPIVRWLSNTLYQNYSNEGISRVRPTLTAEIKHVINFFTCFFTLESET